MNDPLHGLRELSEQYGQPKAAILPLKAFDKCSYQELVELSKEFLSVAMPAEVHAFKLRVELRMNSRDYSKSNTYMLEAYRKTIINALLHLQIKQDIAELQNRFPTVFWRE